jgi:hypothetical protein
MDDAENSVSFIQESAPDDLIQNSTEIEIITDTGKYLINQGITNDGFDLVTDEGRKAAEMQHRLKSRSLFLIIVSLPMSIAPLWLMVMLTLPVWGIKVYSDSMQAGFLTALATNVLGLCYVVARDLFPQSKKDTDK